MRVSVVCFISYTHIPAKSRRGKTACFVELVGDSSIFIFFVSVQISLYMGIVVPEFDCYLQLLQCSEPFFQLFAKSKFALQELTPNSYASIIRRIVNIRCDADASGNQMEKNCASVFGGVYLKSFARI